VCGDAKERPNDLDHFCDFPFRAVIRDSFPARINRVVVINDSESPGTVTGRKVESLYPGFNVAIPSMCDLGALKDAYG
jgi:hypothetical protein